MYECLKLTEEFRQLSDRHANHEDKLQVLCVCVFVECCLATKSLNLSNMKWDGWRCGSGLVEVIT